MFILKNNRNGLIILDIMRCINNVCVKKDQFRFSRIKVNLIFISKFFTSGDHTCTSQTYILNSYYLYLTVDNYLKILLFL